MTRTARRSLTWEGLAPRKRSLTWDAIAPRTIIWDV